MDNLDYVKSEIERLYKADPNIHISVKLSRPRMIVERTPAVIVGVYRNIFQVEESGNGHRARHTVQYNDVLIGDVVIEELNYVPQGNIFNKK